MAKVGPTQYYNLLIGRLNKFIDERVALFCDKPVGTDINFNTGTIHGIKCAIEEIETLINLINKQDIILKDTGHSVRIFEDDKEIVLPPTLRKDFKYD